MKKIVASVGLVAVGVSGLQAASIPGFGGEGEKPWTISATLRGFYDDNINSVTDNSKSRQDSFGFEVSPSVTFGLNMDRTTIGFAYLYSLKYYDTKPLGNSDHYDQTHTFNVDFGHAISDRLRLDIRDSFVIGQEPDTLRAGNTFDTFQRISGDNIRNYGTIDLTYQATPKLGFTLGYQNTYVDYADDHFKVANAIAIDTNVPPTVIGDVQPSHSGTLDRIEHNPHLDGRLTILPTTIGVIGYAYREIDYTADELISGSYLGVDPAHPSAADVTDGLRSDVRNSQSHYGYVGVEHSFRPNLTGTARAGARYTEYPNDPNGTSEVSPYANLSLRWVYAPESFLEVGGSYDLSATDLFSVSSTDPTDITLDAQTASGWASVTHRITPRLFGSLTGQVQNSQYHGGSLDGQSDMFYVIGLNFEYRFNPHLSAHAGYNYDRLDSDLPQRSFDRNRVYVGVTATY